MKNKNVLRTASFVLFIFIMSNSIALPVYTLYETSRMSQNTEQLVAIVERLVDRQIALEARVSVLENEIDNRAAPGGSQGAHHKGN